MKLANALLAAALMAGSGASLLRADKPIIGPDSAGSNAAVAASSAPEAIPSAPDAAPSAPEMAPAATDRPHQAASQKALARHQQVTKRLNKQNKEIAAKIAAGTLTQAQGNALGEHDRKIRAKERALSLKNGGGLSKAEQAELNSRLNDNLGRINAK